MLRRVSLRFYGLTSSPSLSHRDRRLSSLWSDYYYESHDEGLQKLFPQLGALPALYLLLSDRVNASASLCVLEKATNERSHDLELKNLRLQWFYVCFSGGKKDALNKSNMTKTPGESPAVKILLECIFSKMFWRVTKKSSFCRQMAPVAHI